MHITDSISVCLCTFLPVCLCRYAHVFVYLYHLKLFGVCCQFFLLIYSLWEGCHHMFDDYFVFLGCG